ncbi:MAG: glutaminyl-tRNA synthetase, partial [Actinomycetota bacterium]|nr:glutaminyl-tRNA synthetase [Actinomycetota bacterium]
HGFSRPQQIEFARLNIDYTVLSKRKLLRLVEHGHVAGWDDPRMPTIAGMRRRGYRPEAIRAFADLIGVAKVNSTVDLAKLEFCVRDDLNWVAPRVLGVLRPLKVTVTSWPEGEVEWVPRYPSDAPGGDPLPFGRELWIERDDFALDPPAGYHRLAPGRTVRLRHGYLITCDEVVEDGGEVVEVRVHHVPDTVGKTPAGVDVSGVIHWVSAAHAVAAEVRLYDRLFNVPRPEEAEGDLADLLNPASLEVVRGAMLEPSLAAAEPGSRWQLERVGYFVVDTEDSRPEAPVLNRIVTLRDSWQGGRTEDAAAPPDRHEKSDKAKTRPAKRSRAEYRAEARLRDPVLAARFGAWPAEHGISEGDADLLTGDVATGDLFEAAVGAGAPALTVARWIVNDLPPALGDRELTQSSLTGAGLAELVAAVESGTISGGAAKDVLAEMVDRGGDPARIIAARGLSQVSDEGALAAMVDEVIAANPDKAGLYRGGKTALLGFFVGQVIRASGGKANPQVVQKLLAARLGHGG